MLIDKRMQLLKKCNFTQIYYSLNIIMIKILTGLFFFFNDKLILKQICKSKV